MIVETLAASTLAELQLPGEDIDQAYKRIAKLVHPDIHPTNSYAATKAFAHLNNLHSQALKPAEVITIGKYTIEKKLASGDIADLYITKDGDIFKLAKSRTENDLMAREAATLTKLNKANDHFSKYLPIIKDSFNASGRAANILDKPADFLTLKDLWHIADHNYDFRHGVWMMNRLLSVLGYIHSQGFVHGAITPEHLMYRAEDHDMRLIDWCYSTKIGEKIPAIIPEYRYIYPQEVPAKLPCGPGTDIYMAFTILQSRFDVPKAFAGIFDWARAYSINHRPDDAWKLQDLWRKTAKEVYGDPKFVKLNLKKKEG